MNKIIDDKNKDSKVSEKEKLKNFEEMLKKSMVEVDIPTLTAEVKRDINFTLSKLNELKKEIETKKEEVLKRHEAISKKVENLEKSGAIKSDPEYKKKSQDSIDRYKNYLDYILKRVEDDIRYNNNLVSEDSNGKIKLLKQVVEVMPIEDYLKNNLRSTKKEIKKIEKDLRVSSSRYLFDIEQQIKRINYLAAYINASKIKEAKTKTEKVEEKKK